MKNINSILAVGAVAAVCGAAEAALVAYWNFNTLVAAPNTAKVISADQGSGTIFANGTNGSSDWLTPTTHPQLTAFGGSTLNALNSDVAGQALVLANSSANGFSIVLAFDMTGFSDVVVSYATRGTSTGYSQQAWSFSADGVNFTDFETVTGTTSTSFSTKTLSSLSGLNGSATAFLRLTVSGATSAAGNNRLDNIQLNATLVPAPGAVALLGLAGLVAGRRRR